MSNFEGFSLLDGIREVTAYTQGLFCLQGLVVIGVHMFRRGTVM